MVRYDKYFDESSEVAIDLVVSVEYIVSNLYIDTWYLKHAGYKDISLYYIYPACFKYVPLTYRL